MSDYILVQHEAPLATIIFNRPDRRNAISYGMWRELASTLADLDSDQDIRTIVFAGAGDEAFSAGADITDFQKYRSDSQKGALYNDAVNGLLLRLDSMATPTISMIDGFAVGGGCELAIATDLRIASEGSRFGIPVARLGITVGHQEMKGLVNLVGKGNAMYILLSGRLLTTEEALRIGLVNQVLPKAELKDYTYRLANEIANLAPLSHKVNKQTMGQVLAKPSLGDLTPEEAILPLTQFDTQDYREGYRAFLEKRRPSFIGK